MTGDVSKLAKRRGVNVRGRSVLLVVGTLLISSAVLRIAEGAGTAVARESDRVTAQDQSQEYATAEDLAALLQDLRDRESQLQDRERELATRAAAAELAEREVRIAIEELTRVEDELRATMEIADQAVENDLLRLTTVYENMKPQEAAPLFAQMTPSFAAGFLGRMRPDAAAAILAGLDPQAGYAISVILAGQNAEVPRPVQSE